MSGQVRSSKRKHKEGRSREGEPRPVGGGGQKEQLPRETSTCSATWAAAAIPAAEAWRLTGGEEDLCERLSQVVPMFFLSSCRLPLASTQVQLLGLWTSALGKF